MNCALRFHHYIILFLILNISNSFALGLMQVSSLEDMASSPYTPGVSTGNISLAQNMCVGIINALGPFRITFTSTNANGSVFRVRSAAGKYVPYSVSYYTATNSGGTAYQMSSGVESSNFTLLSLGICLLGDTNSFRITFLAADLAAATAGAYTDTLYIKVTAV